MKTCPLLTKACTGLCPTVSCPTTESPDELISVEIPLAPGEDDRSSTKWASCGSGLGFGSGFAMGRKVSPQPDKKNESNNHLKNANDAFCFNFILAPK